MSMVCVFARMEATLMEGVGALEFWGATVESEMWKCL